MDLRILKALSPYSCSSFFELYSKPQERYSFEKYFLLEISLITFNCVPSPLQVIVEQSDMKWVFRTEALIWFGQWLFSKRMLSNKPTNNRHRLKFPTLFCFTKGFTVYDLTTISGEFEIEASFTCSLHMVVYDWALQSWVAWATIPCCLPDETASPHICIYSLAQDQLVLEWVLLRLLKCILSLAHLQLLIKGFSYGEKMGFSSLGEIF